MSTDTEIEVEVLVGEMPEQPCESPTHGRDRSFHDDGPGTHYAQVMHDCIKFKTGDVYIICNRLAQGILWRETLTNIDMFHCLNCGQTLKPGTTVRVLGPVTS